MALIQAGRIGLWDHEYSQVLYGPDGPHQPNPYPFTLGTVPYPATDIGFLSGNDGYIISSGTQHPAAAWKWIEYLSRHPVETNADTYAPVSQMPARATLAQQRGYWESLDEETAAAYQWTLAHAGTVFATPNPNVASALLLALDKVRQGSDSIAALEVAQAQRVQQDVAQQQPVTAQPVPQAPIVVATPQAQQPPAGATTITFAATNLNPADVRQATRAFQAEHPDIVVQIQSASSPAGHPSLATLAQNNDCFATFARIQNNEEAALLLDLKPMLANDQQLSEDDYPAPLLMLYQHAEQLLGLPYAFELRTLAYHQTAFRAAGLEPPDATWTPADFLAAAQALVAHGDVEYGYIPLGTGIEDLFFFVQQQGGQLFIGNGQDIRPNFDDPAVVAAIAWYLDLAPTHNVMPLVDFPYQRDDIPIEGQYERIQAGEVGMWFDYGYGMFALPPSLGSDTVSQRHFDVGIAPLPIGGAGLSNDDIPFAIGLFIAAKTTQPQACWEWLRFLSEQPTLARWSTPARLSIAHSAAYRTQSEPNMVELEGVYDATFAEASEHGMHHQIVPAYVETYWLFEAIKRSSRSGQDETAEAHDQVALAQALKAAQQTTTAFLACITDLGTPGQCAREVDPDYNGYLVE
jgi:multiple sugar transport system substrate-binding protein